MRTFNMMQVWEKSGKEQAHGIRLSDGAVVHPVKGALHIRNPLTGKVSLVLFTRPMSGSPLVCCCLQKLRPSLPCGVESIYCVDVFDQGFSILTASFDGNIRLHRASPGVLADSWDEEVPVRDSSDDSEEELSGAPDADSEEHSAQPDDSEGSWTDEDS
jgi:hypothetical protein